ncbi:MAG TPA: proline--tRNA ligase [Streptosporangiaceae bacterium]|jgi:prolyl-tRNA synthetase
MRWSQMHIPTLREDPADADAPSHRLLVRGGYIRQVQAGHYSLLPLAVRVRAKVMDIIRQEMNAIGAQEVLLPTMHPADIWQRSGRWDSWADVMFRLTDHKGAVNVLAATHEEIFALLAQELNSHKQLPQAWYQFQTKFRDEARPRGGLLRVREFTMKDSYTFDLDPAGLDAAFDRHKAAYFRIFERLGMPVIAVEASSGAMGGRDSIEFMCPAPAGEDHVAHCPGCGYAANVEKATSGLAEAADGPGLPAPERFDTPGVRTIEDLAVGYAAPADRQVKTLVYVVDGKLTLVLLRGDHALNGQKLIDATAAAAVRPAQPEEIREALGALPGSLGAVEVTHLPVVADEALRGRRDMVTGANVDDVHLRGVEVDRDIPVGTWADLREVTAGEPCPSCGHPLEILTAIEVGHIFKLGYKYTKIFDVTVLDAAGKRVHPIMGSYGIGVERAMVSIVERHHDDRGISWPAAIAPFTVVVTVAQAEDAAIAEVGESIYEQLRAAGVDVIVDDRAERAGVKFRDAELTGIPLRVTVGKRGLAEGSVEVTTRETGETVKVAVAEVVAHVCDVLARA